MLKEARNAIKLWRKPLLVRKGRFNNFLMRKRASNLLLVYVHFRAMATHKSEAVEPTVELGRKWLEIEARRNCRQKTLLYHPKQLSDGKHLS